MEEKRRDAGTISPSVSLAGVDSPEYDPASSRRRAGGQKRKASNLSPAGAFSAPSKRVSREKSFISYLPIQNGPLTRARLGDFAAAIGGANSAPAVPAKPEELVSSRDGAVAEEVSKASREWEALETSIEVGVEAIRSRDENAHVVPSHCGWFSWMKPHSIEELTLPSFFDGKSSTRSPDMYMEIRNWIMKKFHTNPNIQIELKDLSELEVGDLATRQEVMEFLDYWGLINFHPLLPKDTIPANVNNHDVEENSTLVEKLYRFEVQQWRPPVALKTNIATTLTMASRLFPESSIAEELDGTEGPNVEYHCNSCSADCSRKRYHCQKQVDFDLCIDCFANGKFGSNMSLSDFIVLEPGEVLGLSGEKWTDYETLLLLEALELYKENWNDIADHVATKTKAQCILHFVQMPIEDVFLDYDDDVYANTKDPTDNVVTNADSSIPKDVPESTELKIDDCEGQPQISSMETSNPEDTNKRNDDHENLKADKGIEVNSCSETLQHEDTVEVETIQETGENFALKALRDAFEAVGCPITEGPISFFDVGNPVMALAAYLARLVEPDIVTASTHCSLRSISGISSGMQLAARHCFLLDDLPHDNKEQGSCGSTGTVDKDASQVENSQKEDNIDDLALEKKQLSDNDEFSIEKSNASKEPDVTGKLEAGSRELNESNKSERVSTSEKSDDSASKMELLPSSVMDSHSLEAPNNVDMTSESLPSENIEPQQPVASTPVEEPSESPETTENVDMVSDSLPLEKIITQQSITANGTGEDNKEKSDSTPKKDWNIDKIKHAATAALSAAAVKAKFLASREEEQIKELAASLIDKQLRKLETKLGFFSEMDYAMIRVKEQMDRSRQKLYHERTQIIAAHHGSAARAMQPPSLPASRTAASFPNSALRPPMNTTTQIPQLPRPSETATPPNPC